MNGCPFCDSWEIWRKSENLDWTMQILNLEFRCDDCKAFWSASSKLSPLYNMGHCSVLSSDLMITSSYNKEGAHNE